MSRNAIRLNNLRLLVAEYGTIAALYEATDVSEKYLSQLLNEAPLPTGSTRKMGDKTAERLEHGCGLPAGWMDIAHQEDHEPSPAPTAERELLRLFRQAPPAQRKAALAVLRLQVKEAS